MDPVSIMKKKIRDGGCLLLEPECVAATGAWKKPPTTVAAYYKWAAHALSGGSRRLGALIAVAGSCLCLYALLIIVKSHYPCSDFISCKSLLRPVRGHGNDQRDHESNHIAKDAMDLQASNNYTPLNLPAQGRASAAMPSVSTNLSRIVFGIAASSSLWYKRKEYIKLWWRPQNMRGFVWLDKKVNHASKDTTTLPPLKISSNTSHFKYTNKLGTRSAIRISRIVSDTFRLGLPDVHWFVMGDDDTVFVPDNLVKVLSKYDHRQYYYIGSNSESHLQNLDFSYNMAYGGGGFAISYPLAKALETMQDDCLERYPGLFGSDDRIQACMAELGVPLTKEPGFHQYDVHGNLFGLMAAHPVTPAISLHHVDLLEPVFPNKTKLGALKHLKKSMAEDPTYFLQQSICYDHERRWSVSVSWGFAVQIYRGLFTPRELELPSRTFYNWHKKADHTGFSFNTRAFSRQPCQKPFVFYMHNISSTNESGQPLIESHYIKEDKSPPECMWKIASPESLDNVKVVKQRDDTMWNKAPRRKCCHVAPSSAAGPTSLRIDVRDCQVGEIA